MWGAFLTDVTARNAARGTSAMTLTYSETTFSHFAKSLIQKDFLHDQTCIHAPKYLI